MGSVGRDEYFLDIAHLVKTRSSCLRRQVGCVLVNHRNHIVATGYNGVPSGWQHCTEATCQRSNSTSGHDLDLCLAIHAEQNALLQCSDVYSVRTCYCTTWPCVWCIKLLMNTSCQRIVYSEDYTSPIDAHIWAMSGREVRCVSNNIS